MLKDTKVRAWKPGGERKAKDRKRSYSHPCHVERSVNQNMRQCVLQSKTQL